MSPNPINWNQPLGQRTLERIQTEAIIWLTTISPGGFPQPRPVWFVWDSSTFLIYSMPAAKKVSHIAHNPNVALHFNSDAGGGDIQIILGKAQFDPQAPAFMQNAAYQAKYHEDILSLGMDEKQYSGMFTAAIRITPVRLRGLDPLPES